jgi:hypothetical protein
MLHVLTVPELERVHAGDLHLAGQKVLTTLTLQDELE